MVLLNRKVWWDGNSLIGQRFYPHSILMKITNNQLKWKFRFYLKAVVWKYFHKNKFADRRHFPRQKIEITTMACDNSTEIRYCDENYPVYIQIMYIYVLSVLIVVGLSGNFISLLVFEIQRGNKGSKTLGLLICFAVADSLFLSSNISVACYQQFQSMFIWARELAWSIHIRPYFTAMASIFQAFAAYMVFAVTLHRYLIITKPLVANIWMSGRKMAAMVLGLFLFSIGFNIPDSLSYMLP